MIIETTIYTPEVKRIINQKIGNPYGLIESIRLGGSGSKRMRIAQTSEQFIPYLTKNQDTVYCSIEKRRHGLAFHFKKYQTVYSWLVPMNEVTFANGETFTFSAENHSISFIKDRNFSENRKFIQRIFSKDIT